MKTSKIVLGTLAGLAIGGIAGILFAPEKGSETRKQIKNKGNESVREIKTKFNRFRVSLSKDVDELVDKGKAKYQNAKKEANANFHHNGAVNTEHSSF